MSANPITITLDPPKTATPSWIQGAIVQKDGRLQFNHQLYSVQPIPGCEQEFRPYASTKVKIQVEDNAITVLRCVDNMPIGWALSIQSRPSAWPHD